MTRRQELQRFANAYAPVVKPRSCIGRRGKWPVVLAMELGQPEPSHDDLSVWLGCRQFGPVREPTIMPWGSAAQAQSWDWRTVAIDALHAVLPSRAEAVRQLYAIEYGDGTNPAVPISERGATLIEEYHHVSNPESVIALTANCAIVGAEVIASNSDTQSAAVYVHTWDNSPTRGALITCFVRTENTGMFDIDSVCEEFAGRLLGDSEDGKKQMQAVFSSPDQTIPRARQHQLRGFKADPAAFL